MRRLGLGSVLLMLVLLVSQAAVAQGPQRPGGRPDDAGRQGRGVPGDPVLQLFDTDKNGSLSTKEIEGASERLRGLDSSKDGNLSLDELRAARGPRGRGRPGGFGFASGSDLDKPPQAKNDAEKRVLKVLDAMSKGPWYANVSPNDGRFLRQLAEAVGAKRVVEVGTSTGYSALWLALALRATGGELYTHEIDPERIKLAQANFEKAGLDDLITIVEGDAHETVKQYQDPVDIVFLDADKSGYVDYLNKLLPLVKPGGLIVAHNMRRPPPDPAYLEAITTNADLDTTFVFMEGAGIGVTIKKR